MPNNKVRYVTGASQGLGLSLVKQLLSAGYRVAATSRPAAVLQEAVGPVGRERFLALSVDLASAAAISQSIEATVAAMPKRAGRQPGEERLKP
jgi:NAD(P)-dependent dehydrogenase (short-subunit alcohol dehydrogenase family)